MTDLRKRMQEDLQLRGLGPKTQEAYVGAVRQLAKHYEKQPDQISEEELFLHLKNEKKVSRSTCTIALCGIKFFYEQTLGREWARLNFVRPVREKKLPVVLSVHYLVPGGGVAEIWRNLVARTQRFSVAGQSAIQAFPG